MQFFGLSRCISSSSSSQREPRRMMPNNTSQSSSSSEKNTTLVVSCSVAVTLRCVCSWAKWRFHCLLACMPWRHSISIWPLQPQDQSIKSTHLLVWGPTQLPLPYKPSDPLTLFTLTHALTVWLAKLAEVVTFALINGHVRWYCLAVVNQELCVKSSVVCHHHDD